MVRSSQEVRYWPASKENAVGNNPLAEGITCLVGVVIHFFVSSNLSTGGWHHLLLSVLFALFLSQPRQSKINTKKLNLFIGILTTALGIVTLYKIIK